MYEPEQRGQSQVRYENNQGKRKRKKKNRNSTLNAASGGGYLFSAMVNSSTCALGLLERTLWKTENAFDTIRDLEGMKERR